MKINEDVIDTVEIVEQQPGLREPYFSWSGCDNCNNGLGNSVYDCKAHINLTKKDHDYYEIKLCGPCINAREYGEEPDSYCENIYNI